MVASDTEKSRHKGPERNNGSADQKARPGFAQARSSGKVVGLRSCIHLETEVARLSTSPKVFKHPAPGNRAPTG